MTLRLNTEPYLMMIIKSKILTFRKLGLSHHKRLQMLYRGNNLWQLKNLEEGKGIFYE